MARKRSYGNSGRKSGGKSGPTKAAGRIDSIMGRQMKGKGRKV